MIARYNQRIRELKNSPSEMYEYMAKSAPFLMEYEQSKNKQDLFNKFLEEVEGEVVNTLNERDYMFIPCMSCSSSNLHYEESSSDMVCLDCGVAQYTFSGERSYKEEQDSDQTIVYSYKRENHFNEWINQFQAKEITNIPSKIIEDIREEIKKNKLTRPSDITQKRIHDFLKKLGYSKYYEHVPYITTIFNGTKPPTMSQELESKLRSMFHMIQKPFDNFCPNERTNFLSYSYILYKFCELLGEDEYLQFFPLLKSREKLYKHDKIWKLITAELRWQYIPTI